MSSDIVLTLSILMATVMLFVWGKFRMDIVAILTLLALIVTGILTPKEALAGFGEPVVVMIAALFIVGDGIFRTGVASSMGQLLVRLGGGSEIRLLLILLTVVSILSTSISSTGTVALLLPVAMNMARKTNIHPARLLMPMAFVVLIAGTTTLIGTPPNMIVNQALRDIGREGFNFFSFTPIGGAILIASFIFMMTIGRKLLPQYSFSDNGIKRASLQDFAERYQISDKLHKVVITDRNLIGVTVSELYLRRKFEVLIFAIKRKGKIMSDYIPALLTTKIEEGDIFWVYGAEDDLQRMCSELPLIVVPHQPSEALRIQRLFGYVEVVVPPRSEFVGATFEQARLRHRFSLNPIGLYRNGELIKPKYSETTLAAGDTFLLTGAWKFIKTLVNERSLLVFNTPIELEEAPATGHRALHAVVVLVLMIIMMANEILPNVAISIMAALAMLACGCIHLKNAYNSLHAQSLIVIAGLLPLAVAMEKTGTVEFVVHGILENINNINGITLLSLLFVLTAILGLFVSNTASTILLAPIGIKLSQQIGVNPEAVMMTIAMAASTSFATPVATPVNMLITTPGEYKFWDFIRVGVPLQLVAMMITLFVVPYFYPL